MRFDCSNIFLDVVSSVALCIVGGKLFASLRAVNCLKAAVAWRAAPSYSAIFSLA
jgi:hypothetical protein